MEISTSNGIGTYLSKMLCLNRKLINAKYVFPSYVYVTYTFTQSKVLLTICWTRAFGWVGQLAKIYVHGPEHCESMSVIAQQNATIYSLLYFRKLLHMFSVMPPPIIRSTCNCSYSIWHWSDGTCYLPLSWRSQIDSSTIAAGSSTSSSARCCNYSYMYSWWWVEVSPETCRAVLQKCIKLYIVASCWTIIEIS